MCTQLRSRARHIRFPRMHVDTLYYSNYLGSIKAYWRLHLSGNSALTLIEIAPNCSKRTRVSLYYYITSQVTKGFSVFMSVTLVEIFFVLLLFDIKRDSLSSRIISIAIPRLILSFGYQLCCSWVWFCHVLIFWMLLVRTRSSWASDMFLVIPYVLLENLSSGVEDNYFEINITIFTVK